MVEILEKYDFINDIPFCVDSFESSQIPTQKEHFEAIRVGIASPIIPGLINEEPDLMILSDESLEKRRRITLRASNFVIDIAKRYKGIILKSGVNTIEAEAAFHRILDRGFNAIRTYDPKQASNALVEPITVIAESEYQGQGH